MSVSKSKLSSMDVLSEGFKPLKRMPTEPTQLSGNRNRSSSHQFSFNAQTGEKESIQFLWENSAWGRLERSKGKVMERANTFVGPAPTYPHRGGPGGSGKDRLELNEAIAVVDPFSTGAHLAKQVALAGYKVVRILSIWDSPVAALVEKGLVVEYCATLQFNDLNPNPDAAMAEIITQIKALPFPVRAVIPGAETGVELADSLSHRLGLRSNGEDGSMARRNKYLMGEKVRAAGVRAVKQQLCRSIEELKDFILTLLPSSPPPSLTTLRDDTIIKCVVKPVQSAGSDDVFLCNTVEEALVAYSRISGKKNGLGLVNDGALIQEFLAGKEYVIDKVSLDGVHKLVAIWQYDKRVCNGANFVYFGMKLVSSESERSQQMVAYSTEVLNALGIRQGPSHMEVMWCGADPTTGQGGYPCLVEVGSRCHGGEGTWIPVAQECVGFTQVSVTVDVYSEGKFFHSMKDGNHYPLAKAGRDVDLVSRHSGIVRAFPGEAAIRSLASFRSLKWECKPGDFINKTIDCFTRPGCCQLVHESEEQADADLEAIHSWEELQMIDYSVMCPRPPVIGAVVIVDPFSTGANLAAMASSWGYQIILVFSELDSPVAKLVAEGANVQPMLLIQHNSRERDQERALKDTLAALDEQEGVHIKSPILAIIPGAETGVELADKLSSRYGTRGNNIAFTPLRRSKFSMQHAIREKGVRAVKQQLCRSEAEVRSFWDSLSGKAVVKPNESAGSDLVFLCNSIDEMIVAFTRIHGQFNGLGQLNDGALCQEFLQGTEYAIDGVTRDGVYKVTAIWEYDKRFANGADFVYFGMRLRSGAGERERALVAYSDEVVRALGITQGPTHMEVIFTATGPCLVEVGTRCHGGEATWSGVAQECVGYTQVEATLNCYLRPDRFEALPHSPQTLLKQGAEVFLVSHQTGTLQATPGLTEIRSMESFRSLVMLTQVGSALAPTIDCFTRPGAIQVVHELPAQLEDDCRRIREMEINEELFTV